MAIEGPRALVAGNWKMARVARPVATFTVIGKNEITKAVVIAGIVPRPNHTTKIGTTATFGMLEKPTSSG